MTPAPDLALLDNIVWHSLCGPHARLSSGGAAARRYARGLSPLTGFADPGQPAFGDLAVHADVGEHLFCAGLTAPMADGWRIDAELVLQQIVWGAPVPPPPGDTGEAGGARLGAEHVDQMLELVAVTQPGPFGPRTIEMGEYFGVFEDERLVAMAGERMWAPGLREISGVCTHPDAQGRGLARALMHLLIRRQLGRGLLPFLHVMQSNTRARQIYERMGFRGYRELPLQVVCRV